MCKLRNILIPAFLTLLFIFYISGVSLFPHTHIVDGATIVHSHPNPDAEHSDGDSYVTIQLLSHFQACGAGEAPHLPVVLEFDLPEPCGLGNIDVPAVKFFKHFGLRAPPVA